MAGIATEAFFLPAEPGHRFCLLNAPAGSARPHGAFVYVHPFAEEMNKARRAAALAARGLAANGFAVLQIDLHGCGDSSGDFGDATWERWLADVAAAYRYLERRYRLAPSLWGLRLGCLLATQALVEIGARPDLLLWQPVLSGRAHLTQFLRIKVVGEALGEATDRVDVKALRARLAGGETLEIAGYALSPALGEPMERAELDLQPGYDGRVLWYEVADSPDAVIGPASRARVDAWRARGIDVHAITVPGLPFWQTQEIDEGVAFVDATTRAWQLLSA